MLTVSNAMNNYRKKLKLQSVEHNGARGLAPNRVLTEGIVSGLSSF